MSNEIEEVNDNNNNDDDETAKLGVIVPLFVSPQQNEASWVQVAGTARRYPRIHVVAAVDVNSGPGLGPDPAIREGVRMLKNNAVTVLAYIHTGMERFSADEVKQDMINWKQWYPEIDGFYLDGVPREDGNVSYFNEIVNYAKNYLGANFVVAELDHEIRDYGRGVKVANRGVPRDLVDRTHIDLFVIYRGRGLPAPLSVYKTTQQKSGIGAWTDEDFPAHRFAIIASKIDIVQTAQVENFIRQAIRDGIARYFYVQTDAGAREIHPEPFTTLSSFFEPTVRLLDDIAAVESKLPIPPPLEEPMTPTKSTPGEGPPPAGRPMPRTPEDEGRASEGDRDLNGVQKIYPTISGVGREWYFRQDGTDPTKDSQLKNWKKASMRRMQDGSNAFYVSDDSLEAWSPKGKNMADSEANKWLNTETTCYFYYIRDKINIGKSPPKKTKTVEPYAFQLYSRSGVQSTTNNSKKAGERCEGACYISAIYKDGRSTIRKKVAGGFYAPNRATQQGVTSHTVKGHWVGLKQVVYNVLEDGEPNTYAIIENYVDQNCTDSRDGKTLIVKNQWILTSRFTDRGPLGDREGLGWGLLDEKDEKKLAALKCKSIGLKRQGLPRKSSDIINTPGGNKEGNCCAIDATGVELKFSHFSVREIVPPRRD